MCAGRRGSKEVRGARRVRGRRLVGRSTPVLLAAAVLAPAAWADGTPVKGPEVSAGARPADQSTVRSHTVQPGETMSSVARGHGVAVSDVARASARAPDAPLAVGTDLKIPPAGPPPGGNGRLPFSQQVAIHSPRGPAYLAPEAARAWEAMREASVRELGVDLYPFGPDSAYRSYGKQVEAWRVFQAGGPEAAPPGSSAHGLGKAVDLASPEMREAVDKLGPRFGWVKTEAPSEWGHINYVGG
jgi:LysM repeat protein